MHGVCACLQSHGRFVMDAAKIFGRPSGSSSSSSSSSSTSRLNELPWVRRNEQFQQFREGTKRKGKDKDGIVWAKALKITSEKKKMVPTYKTQNSEHFDKNTNDLQIIQLEPNSNKLFMHKIKNNKQKQSNK